MTQSNDIVVLQTSDLPPAAQAALNDAFKVRRIPEGEVERQVFLAENGAAVRGIAGSGKGKVDEALLAALPNLEIISVTSAGLDAIDTDAVARRGIPIFSTSAVLADDVADTALWLVLGSTRRLVEADRFVRRGEWSEANYYPLGKTIAGMKVGILGLGHIGKAIAARLELLGAEIGYSGRSRKPEVSFPYFPTVEQLADWSDLLVVSCPATTETFHLVGAAVLKALGPEGILVNIARGSIVDQSALVDALRRGEIFGAGLDVFENEPQVPQALIDSDRTILLPHIGSATEGTRRGMWQHMVRSLQRHFGLPDGA